MISRTIVDDEIAKLDLLLLGKIDIKMLPKTIYSFYYKLSEFLVKNKKQNSVGMAWGGKNMDKGGISIIMFPPIKYLYKEKNVLEGGKYDFISTPAIFFPHRLWMWSDCSKAEGGENIDTGKEYQIFSHSWIFVLYLA